MSLFGGCSAVTQLHRQICVALRTVKKRRRVRGYPFSNKRARRRAPLDRAVSDADAPSVTASKLDAALALHSRLESSSTALPTAASSPLQSPSARAPAPAPRELRCHDCGQEFEAPCGLGIHRVVKHGVQSERSRLREAASLSQRSSPRLPAPTALAVNASQSARAASEEKKVLEEESQEKEEARATAADDGEIFSVSSTPVRRAHGLPSASFSLPYSLKSGLRKRPPAAAAAALVGTPPARVRLVASPASAVDLARAQSTTSASKSALEAHATQRPLDRSISDKDAGGGGGGANEDLKSKSNEDLRALYSLYAISSNGETATSSASAATSCVARSVAVDAAKPASWSKSATRAAATRLSEPTSARKRHRRSESPPLPPPAGVHLLFCPHDASKFWARQRSALRMHMMRGIACCILLVRYG